VPIRRVPERGEQQPCPGPAAEFACSCWASPVSRSLLRRLVTLVENAYRDVNVAFANELSMVCDSLLSPQSLKAGR
jgi:hypothetical protein